MPTTPEKKTPELNDKVLNVVFWGTGLNVMVLLVLLGTNIYNGIVRQRQLEEEVRSKAVEAAKQEATKYLESQDLGKVKAENEAFKRAVEARLTLSEAQQQKKTSESFQQLQAELDERRDKESAEAKTRDQKVLGDLEKQRKHVEDYFLDQAIKEQVAKLGRLSKSQELSSKAEGYFEILDFLCKNNLKQYPWIMGEVDFSARDVLQDAIAALKEMNEKNLPLRFPEYRLVTIECFSTNSPHEVGILKDLINDNWKKVPDELHQLQEQIERSRRK
jgi:hypothetical protein